MRDDDEITMRLAELLTQAQKASVILGISHMLARSVRVAITEVMNDIGEVVSDTDHPVAHTLHGDIYAVLCAMRVAEHAMDESESCAMYNTELMQLRERNPAVMDVLKSSCIETTMAVLQEMLDKEPPERESKESPLFVINTEGSDEPN